MTFFRTIRGVEVIVHAEKFTSDYCGISYGPEEIYAVTLDDDGTEGEQFDLTDEESEQLGIDAAEAYLDWE